MVWIVKEGDKPSEKLPPPPADYPKCLGSPSDFNLVMQTIEQEAAKEKQEVEDAAKKAVHSVGDHIKL